MLSGIINVILLILAWGVLQVGYLKWRDHIISFISENLFFTRCKFFIGHFTEYWGLSWGRPACVLYRCEKCMKKVLVFWYDTILPATPFEKEYNIKKTASSTPTNSCNKMICTGGVCYIQNDTGDDVDAVSSDHPLPTTRKIANRKKFTAPT